MKITEYKKNNGTIVYRSQVYLGVDVITGKEIKTRLTARTKKELKLLAKQKQNEFIRNGSTVHSEIKIKSYKELTDLWWNSYKNTVKPNTVGSVSLLLKNHIIPTFGDYKLDKITTPLIQNKVNKWADKANNNESGAFAHYDKLHALNKRILQYGVTMQLLDNNPALNVVLPRKKKREKTSLKYFDNTELKKFLDYLDGLNQSNYRHHFEVTLYKFLLATGCRINEALALSWSDIDLESSSLSITKTLNRYVEVNTPKSQASIRTIDIDKATVLMLKQYRNRQRIQGLEIGLVPDIVFSDFINKYVNDQTLYTRLRTHFKRAGVSNIGFHGFRHTHATLLYNAGIDPKTLQHRLGHSTISMTLDTYSHLSKENAKKAVSFFETAVNSL
ncbi:tyrosine-type recombinase/integrase [Streptococcus iniae]|uniref:tyrosine-type recombinase/integrase n=1 Tax=Streptococcus iniae TaxID=1346 RepID=UPI000EF69ADC|nr:site-specific integrase [Streptococcus iniae]RLU30208.1 site-specific integrase [Streptococcus iniae]RLU34664.1 site-specific integrase [Streptococcus iniae]RLU35562.1 site-specific integrase [Streptococcus iniae]RLU36209.1 site-specific integrase [Streptococcus iniae]